MPSPSLVSVLRHVRRTAAEAAGVDDAALLERFAVDRDEIAFELLVWRHGPMVLGVCRRQLRDAHAAQDAFQATFLALARRAKSIRRQASVAGWLCRVAGRMALAARQRSARNPEQPLNGIDAAGREPEPADELTLRELRQMLDDAIARLPARYRDPLVLTCFAGRSHAEAAQQLGCAVRTIESRLGRARQKLRAVLLRRGLLPACGLTAALAPHNAPAEVAASLVMATVRAAGNGTTSVVIETLTQGVLHAMLLSKIKIAGAVLAVAGFVGLGTGGLVYQARAIGQAPDVRLPVVAGQPAPSPTSPPTKKEIRQRRLQELLRQLSETMVDADPGDPVLTYLEGLLNAQRDERMRHERESRVAQQLLAIDKAVKKLKAIATEDPGRSMTVPVEGLEDSVRRFKDMIHLSDHPVEGSAKDEPKPGSPANDPSVPTFKIYDKQTGQQILEVVESADGPKVKIKRTAGAGVAVDQFVSVVRYGGDPRYIAKIKIATFNEQFAVAEISELAWRQAVHVGDSILAEPRAR